MGQLRNKCEVDSTSATQSHNGFSDGFSKIYAWIYVHEDEWDQDGVSLETWFFADYDIQIHC